MIVTNAPGVYTQIIDKSQYPTTIGASTAAAMAFISQYGPDNEWILIPNGVRNLTQTYGHVDPFFGQAYLNAYRYSSVSSALYTMRVLPNADDGSTSNPVDPATFSHVIFTIAQDVNNNDLKTVLPVYFNKDPGAANVLVDTTPNPNGISRTDAPTKFTNTFFTKPDGTSTNINVDEYISTPIKLSDAQKNDIESDNGDQGLETLYLSPKNISDLDSTLMPFIIFYAIGRGSYYNNIGFRLKPVVSQPQVFTIEIYMITNVGKITLESFYVSFNPNVRDLSGETYFIEHVINTYSKYLRCQVNKDIIPALTSQSPIDKNKTLVEAIFDKTLYSVDEYNTAIPLAEQVLQCGREGDLFLKNGIINQGVYEECLLKAYHGLYDKRILNKEEMDIDLLIDANFPMAVKQSMVELAEKRGDCFVLLDLLPVGDENEILQTMLSQFGWLNTYLAAVYSPFTIINHPLTGEKVKVSPCYHATYVYPLNDQAGIWKAPAGLRRGTLTDIVRPIVTIDPNETVLSKLSTNRVNPIVRKRGLYVFYGNETSQRISSSLSDINVVRTLLRIDKELSRFLDEFIFEDNVPDTWLEIETGVQEILARYKKEGALYWYRTEVGASDYEIKNHIVHVNVYLSITRPIKVIALTFTVE